MWQGIPIPYGASLDTLKAIVDGPVPERWAAFRALEATPGADALATLVHYASSPDPHVRRAAIEGIGRHADGRLASEAVCDALREAEPFVVQTACRAASTLGLSDTHDLVRLLLLSSSTDTRCAAIAAVDSLWRESDYEAVLRLFKTDPSEDVRKQAAWTLRAHVTVAAWAELFELWWDDPLPRYRTWACEVASAFGTADVAPRLSALANDNNGHVRTAAERALRGTAGAG
jgi:HEAT repeat protein